MSNLLPPKSNLSEPLWLPAPDRPVLRTGELHLWRVRMETPRWTPDDACPVTRDRAEKLTTALFRNDIIERYTGVQEPGVVSHPAFGLRIAVAQCDHVALIAVSRNVREIGLDLERVRDDIPFDEMASRFLDVRSRWDLLTAWSPQEKAWKFFEFWTSNEACAQARPSSTHSCQVGGFSPEPGFIAALAVGEGPESEVLYWDWQY